MLNLIDGGIQHSNLFLHMPLFDEIFYQGFLKGKVRKYKAIREEQPCQILVLNVIRKDEDVVWGSMQDLVKRSVAEAKFSVHGIYVVDLLTMDIHKEIQTFKPAELTELLVNFSRKLTPGATRLIKYSTIYCLMQKTLHEDWGKIIFKTAVEVFKDKSIFLDLLIKQLIKSFEFSHEPGILLLNDLSLNPIFDSGNEQQQERITKLLDKQIPKSIDFPPEVYIQDKNGVRELLSGSII